MNEGENNVFNLEGKKLTSEEKSKRLENEELMEKSKKTAEELIEKQKKLDGDSTEELMKESGKMAEELLEKQKELDEKGREGKDPE
jgi:hypothetical protein